MLAENFPVGIHGTFLRYLEAIFVFAVRFVHIVGFYVVRFKSNGEHSFLHQAANDQSLALRVGESAISDRRRAFSPKVENLNALSSLVLRCRNRSAQSKSQGEDRAW